MKTQETQLLGDALKLAVQLRAQCQDHNAAMERIMDEANTKIAQLTHELNAHIEAGMRAILAECGEAGADPAGFALDLRAFDASGVAILRKLLPDNDLSHTEPMSKRIH